MVDIMTLVNLSLDSAALITVIIGLLLTVVNNTIQKWSKKLFIVLFAILTVYISCNLWSSVSLEITGPAWASQLAIFLESLTSSGAMLILTLMLIHNCGENYKRSPLFFTVLPLFVIYCALLVVTQFTTFIYYITPDNVYMRGPYYFVLLIPAVLIMVVNLVWLFIKRKKLERKQVVAFSVFILAPMICMVVQIFVYGIMFIVLGSALGALYLMVVIPERKNRAAAREHFRIADEAAFHLQHNDEYLLPLRAGPENRSAGYAGLHELSAQELFGDCEGRHNPVHGGAGTHARVPRRGANQI